jgi:GNAT superfamily N-acetyltransferase
MATPTSLRIEPVVPSRLDDLDTLFATNKTTAGCYCMWFLGSVKECHAGWGAGNRQRFGEFVRAANEPAGLLAYRDDEPVGWCAVGPRMRYARMLRAPVLKQRDPSEDANVWLVTCFFVRRDARRSGVTSSLIEAAVTLASSHGATAIEGFPLAGDRRRSASEAFVGVEPLFASSGFSRVAHPTAARVVMRRELRRH